MMIFVKSDECWVENGMFRVEAVLGWENGGQIRFQREILHLYGEFESNRREKFSLTSPPFGTDLPTLLPVDGFCRAIARLKAKSETNSVKETACSYLSSFRCETPFKILGRSSPEKILSVRVALYG